MKKNSKIFFFFFLALIILPFFLLLFRSNHSFMTHDGFYHFERTFYYASSLLEGNIPPSWIRYYNYGSGSPILLFLFPVPYWVSSLFYLLGLNLVVSVKLTFLFFLLIGVISLYLFLRKSLGLSWTASLSGSLLYAYAPYTLVQIFVRGSLRELAGMAIFPLVMFFITKTAKKISISNCGLLGLVLGLFFLTDGISVVLFSLLAAAYLFYLLIRSREKLKFVLAIFSSLILGLLNASYILLPFFGESQFLKWNTASLYQDHFVYFWQYFDPRWGFGFSMPGSWDGMSFQIGLVNIIALFSLIFLLLKKRIKQNLFIILLLINLIVVFILMTYSPLSLFLWDKLKPLRNIQLAWRFLAVVVFITAVFGGLVANFLKIKKKSLILIYFLVLLISIKYLRTNQIVIFKNDYLFNHSEDATAFHEFIPVWRDSTTLGGFANKIEVISGKATFSGEQASNNKITFNANSADNSKIRLNTLYFPGWIASVDKQEIPISITDNKNKEPQEKRDISGFMQIEVPQGEHEILFKFTDTPLRKLGKKLSIIGVLISILLIGLKYLR